MESSSYWDFEESNLKKENEQMGWGRNASIMYTSLHGHDTVFKFD